MPPKDKGKDKAKAGKAKNEPVVAPERPAVIAESILKDDHWWPVIGLVKEDSPVESLLVNLMTDDIPGNNVITLRKDDLLEEARSLVRKQLNPCPTWDELQQMAPKLKSGLKVPAVTLIQEPKPVLPIAPGKQPKSDRADEKPARRKSEAKGQSNKTPAPSNDQPVAEKLNLNDQLLHELELHAKGRPLIEVLDAPDNGLFALLIKWKLLDLKKFDEDLLTLLSPSWNAIPPTAAETVKVPTPTPTKKGKAKDGAKENKPKAAKGAAPATKSDATSKTQKGTSNVSKSKGVPQEAGEGLPNLKPDENLYDVLYSQQTDEDEQPSSKPTKRVPSEVFEVLKKLGAADSPSLAGCRRTENIDSMRKGGLEQGDSQTRAGDLKQMSLAGLVGLKGLPMLDHSWSIRYSIYGLPCFPTSQQIMVRYILLYGFDDPDIMPAVQKARVDVSGIFKVQFLRQKGERPLRMKDLIWVTDPVRLDVSLRMFWDKVEALLNGNTSPPVIKPCPLAVQVKFNVQNKTSLEEFKQLAKETAERVEVLLFELVRAHTYFEHYCKSLKILPFDDTNLKEERAENLIDEDNINESLAKLFSVPEFSSPSSMMERPPESSKIFRRDMTVELFKKLLADKPEHTTVDTKHKIRWIEDRQTFSSDISVMMNPALANGEALSNGLRSVRTYIAKSVALWATYQWEFIMNMFVHIKQHTEANAVRKWSSRKDNNPLVDALSAWRTITTQAKKIPVTMVQQLEFVPPSFGDLFGDTTTSSGSDSTAARVLEKIDNCFAVVRYSVSSLRKELSAARDQYLYSTSKHDPVSNTTFFVFYALHDHLSHRNLCLTETKLDSRSDFETFVCNIMENAQTWIQSSLETANNCPMANRISSQFRLGCQNLFAYQPSAAQCLASPSADHLSHFIRKYSVKALVRLSRDLFASRCGWRVRMKPRSSKSAAKTVSKFIWNRRIRPPPDKCIKQERKPEIPAYAVSNSLSRMVREKERIYGKDVVVAVDTAQSYSGKSSTHLTVWISDNARCHLNRDVDDSRDFSIILSAARVTLHRIDSGTEICIRSGQREIIVPVNGPFCDIHATNSSERLAFLRDHSVFLFNEDREVMLNPCRNRSDIEIEVDDSNEQDHDLVRLSQSVAPNEIFCEDAEGKRVFLCHKPDSVELVTEYACGTRFTLNQQSWNNNESEGSILLEKPGYPRVGHFLSAGVIFLADPNGYLLMRSLTTGDVLIISTTNFILINLNGSISCGKTSDLEVLQSLQEGVEAWSLPVSRLAKLALEFNKLIATIDQMDNRQFVKFSLVDDVLLEVADLDGVLHSVSSNGEVARSKNRHHKDSDLPPTMPLPRIFAVDVRDQTGVEYLFGDFAEALRLKLAGEVKRNDRCLVQCRQGLVCVKLAGCVLEWSYEGQSIVPIQLRSYFRPSRNSHLKTYAADITSIFRQDRGGPPDDILSVTFCPVVTNTQAPYSV